jgi:hypothetical protein
MLAEGSPGITAKLTLPTAYTLPCGYAGKSRLAQLLSATYIRGRIYASV